jgi:LmbE family N-acetylglucosaminyl deacetylase
LILSLEQIHQILMFVMRNKFRLGQVCGGVAATMLLMALVATPTSAAAQTPEKKTDNPTAERSSADHYYEPLPQDTGTTGLKLMLRRLQTTGRLMQVDAHPDDEDGGMLTLESRGKGVSTLLMTLNRGEGGQNKLGSNLFDVLGVLRTLEVLAADRYYGVEQRFSRVADFGYSKTPEETFQKWHGHNIALADIVRVIRTFRPDVLVARFSGTERDGHGHHQASAILTKEAFRAAADPNRFPEQIKEGLQPWQPKKLYIGNVCGFGASTCDPANYTVKLNTGKDDALLGMSYVQFAVEGLRHQQSQGLGDISLPKGDRFAYYELIDSVVESPKDKDGHEQDFFDGIDTTLAGLASQLGEEEKKAPWLRGQLEEIQEKIETAAGTNDAQVLDASLISARTLNARLFNEVAGSELSDRAKSYFQLQLLQRLFLIRYVRGLAAGAKLDAVVDVPVDATAGDAFMAVPGKTLEVTAKFSMPKMQDDKASIKLQLPGGWKSEVVKKELLDNEVVIHFRVQVPLDAQITRPYWHRSDPERDTLNIIDDAKDQGLPFPSPPVEAEASYAEEPLANTVCMVRYKDPAGVVSERPLAIAPVFSVMLDSGEQVVPATDGSEPTVKVEVSSSAAGAPDGSLRLELPAGWKSEPRQLPVHLPKSGDKKDFVFKLFPTTLKEGRAEIRAVLDAGGKKYTEGYTLVTREDLGAAYYYQPAVQRVSIVDVNVPKDLKVGYIMGAGDDIPTVLGQIGMNVTMILADELATEDLSKFETIVLGIRAYDTQKDVIDNNKRLLDYVEKGGRLVVQYNTMGSFGSPIDFNAGKYTPYPTTLSRARVSVEEAPVQILDPTNPIFHSPNEITQKDFAGWVQERGLYFMSQWDANFTPLLESHDPGEAEQKGGLLVAHYGKGMYIYTGYAFFRQLPAGVPGAVRLFVNLISGR